MNILEAATSQSIYAAALAYREAGISVIPCVGKRPALDNWMVLQHRPAVAGVIERWKREGKLQNVGVICGGVSSNLVVIDLDGQKAVEAWEVMYPGLLDTYSVASGSGQGMHLYYRVLNLPPTTRAVGTPHGNIELRANGAYVVAPPSIHPSGKPYTVARRAPVMVLNDMRPVVDWIKRLIAEKHGGKMPPARNAGALQNANAFGRAALAGEAAKVRMARNGRNDTLYTAALKMGSIIADGHISREEVERVLFDAAAHLSADDGEAATVRTIASGIETGLKSPRSSKVKRA